MVTARVITTHNETQGPGTPEHAELALAAQGALSVSAVTGREEPVGNGLELGILRAALGVIEQDDVAAVERLGRLEDLCRQAVVLLQGGRVR